jgi:hypothetical protein
VGPGGQTVAEGFDVAAFNAEMRRLYGRESVFVMPRFATRVYFDVSLPQEAEAGASRVCHATSGPS